MAMSEMSDFPIYHGTLLASSYMVQAFLGEGSFGKVAECAHIITNERVAIKITKDMPFFTEQALEEIKILEQLQTLDPDECSLVRWYGSFFHGGLVCLKFELLDLSLNEYMEERGYALSLRELRPVIHQLSTALLHLKALEIMHADLKPENIMVVDSRQQPLQVKLIDFGLARYVCDALPGTCLQSLWYRAPEVILGQVFSESIDMWSLGLVAAELAVGSPLFNGRHEYDQMKFIVDMLGQPHDYLMDCGIKTSRFFCIESSNDQDTWRLKSPEEFARNTGHYFRDTRWSRYRSLDAMEKMMTIFRNEAEREELRHFVDLLKKMLLVDESERISPLDVLKHPFFSVEHVEQLTDSSEDMDFEKLLATLEEAALEEAEPNVPQLPSSQTNIVHSSELCNAAIKAFTRHEETVFTDPENVSVKPEDAEDKAAHIQPEVVVETSSETVGCFAVFFKRIRTFFSRPFRSS